ncbi:hypothetical protein [Pseudoalteromonas phage PH357]|nr:hypothetical protein [Pseudoalteromonas phage PH357]
MKFKVSLKELISVINNKFYELDKIVEERYQSALKEYEPYRKFKELDLQEACKDFIVTEDIQRSRRKGWLLKKEYYTEQVESLDVVAFTEWVSEECGTKVEFGDPCSDYYYHELCSSIIKSVDVGEYQYPTYIYRAYPIFKPRRWEFENDRPQYTEVKQAKEEIDNMITKFGGDRTIELTRDDLKRMGILGEL